MSQGNFREALTEDFRDGDVLDRFATAQEHERRAEQLRSDALDVARERLQAALPFRADIDLTYDEQADELRATVQLAEAADALADAFDDAAVQLSAPMELTLVDAESDRATAGAPAPPVDDPAAEPPMSDGGRTATAAASRPADAGGDAPRPLSDIIAELEAEYEDGAPVEHIKHEARAAGHDPDAVAQKLDALRERGDVYEPTAGCLRAR